MELFCASLPVPPQPEERFQVFLKTYPFRLHRSRRDPLVKAAPVLLRRPEAALRRFERYLSDSQRWEALGVPSWLVGLMLMPPEQWTTAIKEHELPPEARGSEPVTTMEQLVARIGHENVQKGQDALHAIVERAWLDEALD